MSASVEQLRKIGRHVLAKLRLEGNGLRSKLSWSDYHGFAKALLPDAYLIESIATLEVDPSDIQLEVVSVTQDLTGEVHLHRFATAFIACIGDPEHFPEAVGALAFIDGQWQPIASGKIVEVPAGTPHGFTVDSGGLLFFLSIQSPPIHREEDGRDDYVPVG